MQGNKSWFHSLDFEIKPGETVAIHCERDIGKLFLDILIGSNYTSTGTLRYFGIENSKKWLEFKRRVGISFQNEGIYDRLTVYEYLKFYRDIFSATTNIDEYIQKANLQSFRNVKIKKLNASAQRRVSIIKSVIHQPEILIMEEPDQNIDLESKVILKQLILELAAKKVAILVITSNMESAIIMAETVFRLNDEGLKQVNVFDKNYEMTMEDQSSNDLELEMDNQEQEESQTLQVHFERIPAKVDEKFILFDPTEIDYIESNEGTVLLHVKGESFPCMMTLNQLEERLERFGFFRCHRSYIVNLQKVRELMTWTRNSYSLILDDKKKSNIPLSKGNLSELKDILKM
ncbi:transcriptional regulator [Alkalihalobacillus pseudalcaliphilus]|nr:transcriptional regulator [Alkalihalobacillus pseudalcaliphilus]